MQTPSAPYNDLVSTQTITNEGLNMPGQDVFDISSEPGKTLFLIAKLSS